MDCRRKWSKAGTRWARAAIGYRCWVSISVTVAFAAEASLALRKWVTQGAYFQALAEDQAQRYSLDGQPVGPVSAEHQLVAAIGLLNRTLRYASKEPAQQTKVRQVAAVVAGRPVLSMRR